MKLLILAIATCSLLLATFVCAEEVKRVPTLNELQAIAGTQASSEAFVKFIEEFDFSENPKRERSWGSSFGVFLEQSKTGVVSVVIRPPSRMTNMPTYKGQLPKKLTAEDTINAIQKNLGKPNRTAGPNSGSYRMYYDEFYVITLRGRLFEIWLTKIHKKAKPSKSKKNSF